MIKKRYSYILIFSVVSTIIGIAVLNYFIDPIGVYSNNKKYLHIENKALPDYVSLKIFSNFYDYAIIGTSRSQKIDTNLTKKYGYSSTNLSISASSIKINNQILKSVKKLNKKTIFFLDVYTLALNNYDYNYKKREKLHIIENETTKIFENSLYRDLKYLFSKDTIRHSFKVLFFEITKKKRDFFWKEESKDRFYESGDAKRYLESDYFTNFQIDNNLIESLKLKFDEKDYLIIPPSYYEVYYLMYKKGILDKYFNSLEKLFDSKASIVTFLMPTELLTNKKFYDDALHLKYLYSDKIIDDIFNYNKKYSLVITKNNFDEYKKNLYAWFEKKKSSD